MREWTPEFDDIGITGAVAVTAGIEFSTTLAVNGTLATEVAASATSVGWFTYLSASLNPATLALGFIPRGLVEEALGQKKKIY